MKKDKKEFDIERTEYDEKVEEIRKKKRSLRNLQEPELVKKIKCLHRIAFSSSVGIAGLAGILSLLLAGDALPVYEWVAIYCRV